MSDRIYVNVRGVKGTTRSIAAMDSEFSKSVVRLAQGYAKLLKDRLQSAARAEYFLTATGRFARSLGTRVHVSSNASGGTEANIQVTMITYRESKFLTAFAQGGFTRFPVDEYPIFAKGAEVFDTSRMGKRDTFRKMAEIARLGQKPRAGGGRGVFSGDPGIEPAGRLKVPAAGYTTRTLRNRREVTEANPIGFEPGGGLPLNPFIYPLWVTHPPIERDIVADTVRDFAKTYAKQQMGAAQVIFNPRNIQAGITFRETPAAQVRRVADFPEVVNYRRTHIPGTNIPVRSLDPSFNPRRK